MNVRNSNFNALFSKSTGLRKVLWWPELLQAIFLNLELWVEYEKLNYTKKC
jgi:hypothetical protein